MLPSTSLENDQLLGKLEHPSDHALQVGERSLYPALHRLERGGLDPVGRGSFGCNRRARYYRITAAGRRQLAEKEAEWLRAADAITRVLRLA